MPPFMRRWPRSAAPTGLTVTAASGRRNSGDTLPGLAGYWTFNEGSGTTAADSSGNGLTATLSNGVTWTTGAVGGAVSANGVNQYVTIPSINLTGDERRQRRHVGEPDLYQRRRRRAPGIQQQFQQHQRTRSDSSPKARPIAALQPPRSALMGNTGYDIKCYTQPTSGVWHHLAVVYDYTQSAASSITFYVDGVLQTALSQPFSSNNSAKFGNFPVYLFSRGGYLQLQRRTDRRSADLQSRA